MQIYGIYLIDKIASGGNRRNIDVFNSIAKMGVPVTVFVNAIFKDEFIGCNTEAIPIKLKKGKRVSLQIAEQLKDFLVQNKERLFPTNTTISNDRYVIVFNETSWNASNVLKNFSGAKIVFAYRSDMIEEIKSFFKYESLNLKKRIFFTLQYLVTRYREKMIAKKATLIVFQTENDRKHFFERNKKIKAKTVIIPNDILQTRFKSEYKDKNNSISCKRFLFVGSYDIRKGLIFFLKALVIVKKAGIPFKASVLVMGKELPSISKFMKEHELDNEVNFITNAKIAFPFMIDHDVLIVPSIFDSFPNVIMEALHVGIPVFASNTSGMPYMLQDEKLLFEVANPNSIAKKLIDCLTNTDYYLEIKNLCHEMRKKFEFNWGEKWIEAILETYHTSP